MKTNREWKKTGKSESSEGSWGWGAWEGMKERKSEGRALTLFDCRDGSASATYYFQDQSAAEIGNKSWLYLQSLKTEEEEMSVRSEQVRGSRRGGGLETKKYMQTG